MSTSPLTRLCLYGYDPLDRLTSHTQSTTPERHRFYCKNRLATEIQGAMHHSIVQHEDRLLAQQRSEGDALDTTLLATDQQRSVLNTLKVNHPRHPIAYSPYGHRPAANWLLSLLGFNGERPDPVTGWYLLGNGYRPFNPVLMMFTSPDSLSPFGKGGLNCYAYCLRDPINNSDPTGQYSIFQFLKAKIFGKVSLIYEHGIDSTIRSGVLAKDALTAADNINNLRMTLSSKRMELHTQFNIDYDNRFYLELGNSTPRTLKNIAARQVAASGLSTAELPQDLPRLVNNIKQHPNHAQGHFFDQVAHSEWGHRKLDETQLRHIAHTNTPKARMAQSYTNRLELPEIYNLEDKIRSIRDKHFNRY